MFGEEHGHDGHVPGVLGIGLLAAAADGVVLAADFLELVDLKEEAELLGDAGHGVWKTEEKPKCGKLENWKRRAEAEAAAEEENLELRKLRNGKQGGGE